LKLVDKDTVDPLGEMSGKIRATQHFQRECFLISKIQKSALRFVALISNKRFPCTSEESPDE